jgi:hypothetical protein
MRNFLTLLGAAARRNEPASQPLNCTFRVMPWEVGIGTFKSDRYFAAAEASQLDFVTRTGLLRPMLRQRIRWVNVAQASILRSPLQLLQRFVVTTRVLCVDDKHAYFSHRFSSRAGDHAEVLVKVKFKSGSLTVRPDLLLGVQSTIKSPAIVALDGIAL